MRIVLGQSGILQGDQDIFWWMRCAYPPYAFIPLADLISVSLTFVRGRLAYGQDEGSGFGHSRSCQQSPSAEESFALPRLRPCAALR